MYRTAVWETISAHNTDVVLPNGDMVHTPLLGTLTVRDWSRYRSTREYLLERQRALMARPAATRPRRTFGPPDHSLVDAR